MTDVNLKNYKQIDEAATLNDVAVTRILTKTEVIVLDTESAVDAFNEHCDDWLLYRLE